MWIKDIHAYSPKDLGCILWPLTHLKNILMKMPGRGEWFKARKEANPDFHPDPNKEKDPVEDLIGQYGPEGAVAELERRLAENPGDPEAVRQLNLIKNRLQDLVFHINQRTAH